MSIERLNFIFVPAGLNDGCSFYRMVQPARAIQQSGLADAHILYASDYNSGEKLEALTQNPSVVIFQRLIYREATQKWQENNPHCLMVQENDDNMFEPDPFNSAYRDHGISEVIVPDPTGFWKSCVKERGLNDQILEDGSVMLWKDGRFGFDVKHNIDKKKCFADGLRSADLLTVTGDPLAKLYKPFNKTIKVIPNAINFELWDLADKNRGKEIRIGWHGSASHYKDWFEWFPLLGEMCKKYPNIKLVISGELFPAIYNFVPKKQIEWHRWIHIEAHSYAQRLLKLDFALIPLIEDNFNKCKSDLKWLEYSAMGVPCVISYQTPYKEVAGKLKLAKFGKTEKEIKKQIEWMITHKKEREALGLKAHKWVKENRNIHTMVPEFIQYFQDRLKLKLERLEKKHVKSANV